jgi:sec-independent protein translocase protein TatA
MFRSLEAFWPLIVLLIVLLWGAPKLPGMAKSLGQSIRAFKKEMKKPDEVDETKPEEGKAGDKPAGD